MIQAIVRSAVSLCLTVGYLVSRHVLHLAGGGSTLTLCCLRLASRLVLLLSDAHGLRKTPCLDFRGGEAEWVEYTPGLVDEDAVLVWLPGGAFIVHDGFADGIVSALLSRLAQRAIMVPRVLVVRYSLPARANTTAASIEQQLRSLCPGKRVLIAGDSAGGHLAVSIMLRGGLSPPAAALAVCPWLDLTHTSSAHIRNASVDCLHRDLLEHGASTFVGLTKHECREDSSPAHADPERLAALRPHSVLIIRGARDILADDGLLFASRAEEARAPPCAISVHTVDDGVWGAHCGLLLPLADYCSTAVHEAMDRMSRFIAESLELRVSPFVETQRDSLF